MSIGKSILGFLSQTSLGKNMILSKLNSLTIQGYQLNNIIVIKDVEIDKVKKTVKLIFEMKGEADSIEININGYHLSEINKSIVFDDVSSSKEWLALIGKQFLIGKEIPLHDKYNNVSLIL